MKDLDRILQRLDGLEQLWMMTGDGYWLAKYSLLLWVLEDD